MDLSGIIIAIACIVLFFGAFVWLEIHSRRRKAVAAQQETASPVEHSTLSE